MTMFEKRKKQAKQLSMWVASADLPVGAGDPFYLALEATLDTIGFADRVREICQSSYAFVGWAVGLGLTQRFISRC